MGRPSDDVDWMLVSKIRPSKHQSLERLKFSSVSVFVDYLPFEMDFVWLCQLFRSYGEVVDVYIPKKKSSRFHTKFGFVRFKSKDEALRAIQELDGICIRDSNIQMNLAWYSHSSNNMIFFAEIRCLHC